MSADKARQILISGLGGQGVLFATNILLQAALDRDLDVLASETHGMAQRGGSVVSHVKLGSFLSPLIRSGSADMILSLQREEAFRNLHFVRPGGTVVINAHGLTDGQEALANTLKQRGVEFIIADATGIAKSAGSARSGNVALLGVASRSGAFPFDTGELRRAVEALSPETRRASNLKILEAALRP